MDVINIVTEEQKIKAVMSVYSNRNKLLIATALHALKRANTAELVMRTGVEQSHVTHILKYMKAAGVVQSTTDGYKVFYRLTKLGLKIINLFI